MFSNNSEKELQIERQDIQGIYHDLCFSNTEHAEASESGIIFIFIAQP